MWSQSQCIPLGWQTVGLNAALGAVEELLLGDLAGASLVLALSRRILRLDRRKRVRPAPTTWRSERDEKWKKMRLGKLPQRGGEEGRD